MNLYVFILLCSIEQETLYSLENHDYHDDVFFFDKKYGQGEITYSSFIEKNGTHLTNICGYIHTWSCIHRQVIFVLEKASTHWCGNIYTYGCNWKCSIDLNSVSSSAGIIMSRRKNNSLSRAYRNARHLQAFLECKQSPSLDSCATQKELDSTNSVSQDKNVIQESINVDNGVMFG